MNKVDRLLLKVVPSKVGVSIAFISPGSASHPYRAECHLWDGVHRSDRAIVSEHKTEQKARDAIHRTIEQYPDSRRVPIIFDDLDMEDI